MPDEIKTQTNNKPTAEMKKVIRKPFKLNEEQKKKLAIAYTGEDAERYNYYIRKFEDSLRQRMQKRREFDDLTYEEDYQLNKDAANTYLRKKKNDDEVRVNSGSVEKKVELNN